MDFFSVNLPGAMLTSLKKKKLFKKNKHVVSLLKFYLENGQHYQEFNNPSIVLVFPQGCYSECQIKGIV